MACISGKSGVVQIDSTPVAQVRSYTITETGETADCTSMSSGGYRTFTPTLNTWEGSMDLVWDSQDLVAGLAVGGTAVTLTVYPEGTGYNMEGDVIITSMEITGEYDGIVEASVGFTGTGTLTRSAS